MFVVHDPYNSDDGSLAKFKFMKCAAVSTTVPYILVRSFADNVVTSEDEKFVKHRSHIGAKRVLYGFW